MEKRYQKTYKEQRKTTRKGKKKSPQKNEKERNCIKKIKFHANRLDLQSSIICRKIV